MSECKKELMEMFAKRLMKYDKNRESYGIIFLDIGYLSTD